MMNPLAVVSITFANPVKGVVQIRRVSPWGVRWGVLAECCPAASHLGVRGAEWLLDAEDIEKPGYPMKSFPLACIVKWEACPQVAL